MLSACFCAKRADALSTPVRPTRMRSTLALSMLMLAGVGSAAHADAAGEALVQRVLDQVQATTPIVVEYDITYRYGKTFATEHVKAFATAHSSGSEGKVSGQASDPPFQPGNLLFSTMTFLPNMMNMHREQVNPMQMAGQPIRAAVARISALPPRYVGKETVGGAIYEVVDVDAPLMRLGDEVGSSITLRWYVGQDNFIHRITTRVLHREFAVVPFGQPMQAPAKPDKGGAKQAAKPVSVPAPSASGKAGLAGTASDDVLVEASTTSIRKAFVAAPRPLTNAPLALRVPKLRLRRTQTVALSPDGTLLATNGDDHAIDIFDTITGEKKFSLQGHAGDAQCLQFAPDSKTLASVEDTDASLRLWDVTTGMLLRPLQGEGLGVISLAFSPDGKRLAVSCHSTRQHIWDTQTGAHLLTLDQLAARSATFSPDGTRLVIIDVFGAGLWDAVTGRKIRALAKDLNFAPVAAFSPDGCWIAVGKDKTVLLYDGQSGEPKQELSGAAGRLAAFAFTPDGKTLLAVDVDARSDIPDNKPGLMMWNTADWRVSEARELAGGRWVDTLNPPVIAPLARRLLMWDTYGGMQIWDLAEALPSAPVPKP